VAGVSELRKKLAKLGAGFRVAKNTLLKLAAEKMALPFEELSGPTAVLLSGEGDPIECVKALVSLFKEQDKGEIKFGVFSARGGSALVREGSLLSAVEVLELARIPSRAVLEGRLVGLLSAPLSQFAVVLQGPQRGLVSVLDQISKGKGGEAA
jgi:large subunit ribosomal protein L10